MELILNLIWFAVASSLTGFLIRHQGTRAFHLRWGTVLAACLFIAVLLFPAISASDDLYGELFVSEDTSRRVHSLISAQFDLAGAVALLSPNLFSLSLARLRYAGRVMELSSPRGQISIFLPASGLRAPPPSLSL